MQVRVIDVLRSLLFYLIFYFGSIFYVLGALASLPLGVRPLRAMVHGWSGYHRTCAHYILGIRLKVEGSLPSGPVLVAVKHESFYEAIDLPTLLPLPVVFAKAQLIRLPLWGRAAAGYGVVPVERDQGAKALRAMVTSARAWASDGRPLAIFPEGTRVPHGTQPPLQAGFAGLYKLLGLPVVAVAVNSGPLYHHTWKRAGTITARFAEPIPPGLPREEIEARVLAAINALNTEAKPSA
jgi:1-acyl-sn-glycerol-3-phosphate acyltransferase